MHNTTQTGDHMFNKYGFDRDGYGRDEYDWQGYDRDGYNRWGFDRDGYNRWGFDRDGYNRDGFEQYPSCRFEVLANGAFRNYRNKYHLGFNQQADRLSSFRWFQMAYRCEAHQYESLATDLLLWLSTGKKRDSR